VEEGGKVISFRLIMPAKRKKKKKTAFMKITGETNFVVKKEGERTHTKKRGGGRRKKGVCGKRNSMEAKANRGGKRPSPPKFVKGGSILTGKKKRERKGEALQGKKGKIQRVLRASTRNAEGAKPTRKKDKDA